MIDGIILSPQNEPFLKKILQDKNEIKVLLEVLMSWVRDCLLLKIGVSTQRLVHQKRLHDVDHFTQKHSLKDLESVKGDIIKAFYLLKENLNMKIPLLLIKEKL